MARGWKTGEALARYLSLITGKGRKCYEIVKGRVGSGESGHRA